MITSGCVEERCPVLAVKDEYIRVVFDENAPQFSVTFAASNMKRLTSASAWRTSLTTTT